MQEKYDVTGMTCAACQARVQKSVACLNGVQECNVNLLKNSIEQTKNHLANYIASEFFERARRDSPSRALETPHRGVSAPRDAKRGARAVRIPSFTAP